MNPTRHSALRRLHSAPPGLPISQPAALPHRSSHPSRPLAIPQESTLLHNVAIGLPVVDFFFFRFCVLCFEMQGQTLNIVPAVETSADTTMHTSAFAPHSGMSFSFARIWHLALFLQRTLARGDGVMTRDARFLTGNRAPKVPCGASQFQPPLVVTPLASFFLPSIFFSLSILFF